MPLHQIPSSGSTLLRTVGAALAVSALWMMLGPALPAGAHASVVSTNPPEGATLDTAPAEVTITFTEPVDITAGSVVVVDAAGAVVSESATSEGPTISASLASGIEGWHAVSWSAVSQDGHPISGAWTFRVGVGDDAAPEGLEASAAEALRSSDAARWSFFISQWASTLATAVLVGTLFVIVIVGYLRPLVPIGVAAGALAAIASVYAAGTNGPYVAVGASWFGGPASGEYLGRAILTAAALAVIWFSRPRHHEDTDRPFQARAIPLMLAATGFGLPVLSGHAASDGGAAVMAVMAHLVVAGCWLGAAPAMYVVVRSDGRHHLAVFSRAASWLLAAILVAGGASVLLLTGGLTNATQSWGWALFAKFALLGFAIAAGAWNRWRVVPNAATMSERDSTIGLRVEAVVLVLIVAASMAMTHNGPPRDDASASGPVTIDAQPSDDVQVQLIIDPARVGTNHIHLFILDADGGPIDAEEVTLAISSPDLGIGPIEQDLSDLGAGHHSGRTDDLGISGEWIADLVIRPDAFAQVELSEPVEIRP